MPCPHGAPDWVKECVKSVMKKEGYDEDRAYSICMAQYKKKKGLTETSNSLSKLVRLSQPWEYAFAFEKSVDPEQGIRAIQGYASTEDVDLDMEIVTREAMAGAVAGYMSHEGRYATVRFMHDKSRPIGKVVDAQPTKKGLFVKAVLAQGTQAAEEAWNLIEQGVITAFSIGGKVLEAQREKLDDGRTVNKITKLNWAETSIVDSPANRSTMFSVLSKSVDPALDELEELYKQKDDKEEKKPEKCPKCGTPLENGKCPKCGYEKKEAPVKMEKQKENLKPKKSTLEEQVWKKINQ